MFPSATCQNAQYGPEPAGVLRDSIAVNTLRPKKKGNPQSNVPALGPASPGKTEAEVFEKRESAFCTIKFTVADTPFEVVVADRFAGEVGQ